MAKDIKLSSGYSMPLVGLGTWKSNPEEVKTAVRSALDAGYRMIDTAYNYLNEDAIGEVLEEYIKGGKIKREDIFVTTKLASIYSRPADVNHSMSESLRKLRLDYVDLYLVHTPMTLQNTGDPNNVFPMKDNQFLVDNTVDICDLWKAMEMLVDSKKAKSIGISNFNSQQVDAICQMARIKPVVNQVECHAYFPQNELQAFCAERGIVIMAYSPIGSPGLREGQTAQSESPVLLENKTVAELAKKYNKTPAQILLRNLIQRGIIVIPKSVTPSRIQSNIQVYDFKLTELEMKAIEKIKTGQRLHVIMATMMNDCKNYPFGIPF